MRRPWASSSSHGKGRRVGDPGVADLQAAAQRRALKEELLALTEGENLGASTTEETLEEISGSCDGPSCGAQPDGGWL